MQETRFPAFKVHVPPHFQVSLICLQGAQVVGWNQCLGLSGLGNHGLEAPTPAGFR